MKRKLIFNVVTAAMALGVASAHAAGASDSGWYGGLQLGRSNLGLNGGNINSALANQGITGSAGIEGHDTTWGVNGGYRFTPNYSLEAAYAGLGDYNYNATTTAPGADNVAGKFKAKAWSLSAVGTLPLDSKWSLYGKAGLTRVTADLSASSITGATSPSGKSDTNTGLLIGAGVNYDFGSNVFGKVGLDRYNHVGNAATGSGSIDLVSFGVGMKF